MGNEEGRAVGVGDAQRALHVPLTEVVQGAGRLVEHQDRGVLHENPSYGQALALASGEVLAAFSDLGIVGAGHLQDLMFQGAQFRGVADVFRGDILVAVGNVLRDRTGKNKGVLANVAEQPGDVLPADRVQGYSAQEH